MDYMIIGGSTIITADGTRELSEERRAVYDLYAESFDVLQHPMPMVEEKPR